MSEYLSKEEIKQWRSSLEKITLEEFAARLGKKVEEKKETNDLIDIVLHGQPVVSYETEKSSTKAERLTSIAEKAYEKEREIYVSPFSAKNLKTETPEDDNEKVAIKKAKKEKITTPKPRKVKETKALKEAREEIKKPIINDETRQKVRIALKKALTQREQKVLDYFMGHQNETVYAKDLAALLEVPRDYVYKYIKNIRDKISDGEKLKNAEKGGFIFSDN